MELLAGGYCPVWDFIRPRDVGRAYGKRVRRSCYGCRFAPAGQKPQFAAGLIPNALMSACVWVSLAYVENFRIYRFGNWCGDHCCHQLLDWQQAYSWMPVQATTD